MPAPITPMPAMTLHSVFELTAPHTEIRPRASEGCSFGSPVKWVLLVGALIILEGQGEYEYQSPHLGPRSRHGKVEISDFSSREGVALLGIAQRQICVPYVHSKSRYRPRKSTPINPKTLGDYLLLKRINADLSQKQMAIKLRITDRKVMAWEHDLLLPTEVEWQQVATQLDVDLHLLKSKTQH